jgi:protein-L-isoaspartate O-methyltransferase
VEVPEQLTEQLGAGGRIAIPVGGGAGQTLLIGERDSAGKTSWTEDVACLFVPLVSADDD